MVAAGLAKITSFGAAVVTVAAHGVDLGVRVGARNGSARARGDGVLVGATTAADAKVLPPPTPVARGSWPVPIVSSPLPNSENNATPTAATPVTSSHPDTR